VLPAQRLDYWVGAISEGFLAMDASSPVQRSFRGELVSAPLGPIGVNQVTGDPQQVWRTSRGISRSRHNFCYLLGNLASPWRVEQDGRRAVLAAGDFTLVDSRRPYHFDFPEGPSPSRWSCHWNGWREAFINDADLALATHSFEQLNPHPYKTFQDKIELSQPLAAMPVPKSYINCRMDTALPQSLGWHPRLSEKLGLFRYVECSGSHEVWFTDPAAIAAAIELAGRD
jgi:hypothetical protein